LKEKVTKKALDTGFEVISEVGKKKPDEKLPLSLVHQQIEQDLANGVSKVIVKARKPGKGVEIYDRDRNVKISEVNAILSGIAAVNTLPWKTPIKNQQQYLLLRFAGIEIWI